MSHKTLMLYEQILLLGLGDKKGTISTGFMEHAMAGAVLTELLLEGSIRIDDDRHRTVVLSRREATVGMPDESLESRPAGLAGWLVLVVALFRWVDTHLQKSA